MNRLALIGALIWGVSLAGCGYVDDRPRGAQAQSASGQAPSPGPDAGDSNPLNPTLLSLPVQRWIRIEPGPSTRYVPRKFLTSDVLEANPNPQGRDYSGILYGDGMLIYFGGGHAGYMGNDVEVYDIRRNVWTQSYKPEAAPENAPDTAWQARLAPMGRPWVEHTYQVGCYDAANKTVMWLLQYGGTMRFDLKTREWTPLAGRHIGRPASEALVGQAWGTRVCLGYDPDLRTYLAMETSTFQGVYAWRGGSWSYYGPSPRSNWRTPYSAYMADRRAYFIWNGEGWWVFQAKEKRWTAVAAPAGAQIHSFDYDTLNRVIVGASYGKGDFRMWTVRPDDGAWTELPVGTPRPEPPIGGSAAAPLLRYDPLHNVFFFVVFHPGGGGSSRPTELWAWRYR